MATVEQAFLVFSTTKLRMLMGQIETCMGKLEDAQVWGRTGDNANSAGNLCLHLEGNVRQFIIHSIGGQPDVRVRDAEFGSRGGLTKQELLSKLSACVEEACAVLEKLAPERLLETVAPMGRAMLTLDAIYQVVQHFALHTGQIIFLTKAFTGEDLNLPRLATK
ncbi:DUF1572 family protein [uncultured Paludibaculum sp.]|uniref:DUF1572 family protein n=1 Tax=uncultured Paludibaculum sp. TaxID=1765020 RepID=UPI002AAA7CF6|nr:DUF1572 family protein [uncultured Paludibaculum sp.]